MTAKKKSKAPKKTGDALTREAMAVINKNLANIEAEEQKAAAIATGPAASDAAPPTSPRAAKGRKGRRPATEKPTAVKDAPKAKVGGRRTKSPKAPKEKRLSALDAAAQVLASAKEPMNTKSLIAEMEKKGLWKSPGGKTPAATLYAAIIREIGTKKREARFVKTERGLFTFNAKSAK